LYLCEERARSRHKFNNKKDSNHNEIEAVFRALGFVVFDISNLPHCFDMLVAKNGHTICVEVKDGSKTPCYRKLTTGEAKFAELWIKGGNWVKVETVADVEAINRAIIKKENGFI